MEIVNFCLHPSDGADHGIAHLCLYVPDRVHEQPVQGEAVELVPPHEYPEGNFLHHGPVKDIGGSGSEDVHVLLD